jgi:AAA+ superfamily predicted ATPase
MKEVIRFLDDNNKKIFKEELNQDAKSESTSNQNQKSKPKESSCCSSSNLISDDKKLELNNFLKKVDDNFIQSNLHYGWTHKDMLKYKYEKYDPNLYNSTKLMNQRLRKRLFSALENPRTIIPQPIPKSIVPNKNRERIEINAEINNIEDLLKVINDNPFDDNKEYNINMTALYNIKPYLEKLNNMVGMKDLKENILDQILYFIQDLHKSTNNAVSGDFMHTVIYGPPGTGKTEVARIIGKIFSKLDILKKGTFKKVTRTDLVAGYLGQTAAKTNDVINECLGGVLFIDEAYALGNAEKRDSFSKECIDTLCEALSNHKDKLMVIIAGYESELKECFFAYNQGLESRFTWRFKTGQYNGKELYDIFLKKVTSIGWTMDESIDVKWFEKNAVYFKFYGRDIETVLSKAKIAHSRRIFCKSEDNKKKLCKKDLEKGFDNFLKIEEVKNRKEDDDNSRRLGMLYI